MERPRDSNLTRASLPGAPRCGPTDFATRGLRTQEVRPSLDGYLVEAALVFARTCATTFGMRTARVSARFADVTQSTNSLRCENQKRSSVCAWTRNPARAGGPEALPRSGQEQRSRIRLCDRAERDRTHGRAGAGDLRESAANAGTGRVNPLRASSPTAIVSASASTAAWTRWLSRICPAFASAERRCARITTLPIAP